MVADDWGVPVEKLPEGLRELVIDRGLGNPMAAIALASVAKEGGELCTNKDSPGGKVRRKRYLFFYNCAGLIIA